MCRGGGGGEARGAHPTAGPSHFIAMGGGGLLVRGGGVQPPQRPPPPPSGQPPQPPPPPPPSGGAEVLEARKKIIGLNELAPKAPEKTFDRPKARRKIWAGAGGGAEQCSGVEL